MTTDGGRATSHPLFVFPEIGSHHNYRKPPANDIKHGGRHHGEHQAVEARKKKKDRIMILVGRGSGSHADGGHSVSHA